jgi:monofunctional biosynthetic peptidoglycan transglycosylase
MPPHSDKKSPPRFGRFVLLSTLGSLIGATLIIWGVYKITQREFPDVAVLKNHYPVVTYQGPKSPVHVEIKPRPPGYWVRFADISKNVVGAVVVSEDWTFFSHSGYDPDELKASAKEVIAERRFVRGGSTITMQLVKNVFLTHEKSLYRKFKEFILAIQLDRALTKNRILEIYFNVVEFGPGIYGIRQASQYYFNKNPWELSPKEGAFIAMLLPSPKKYSQSFRNKQLSVYATKTIGNILNKMVKARYISEEEKDLALSTPLSFEVPTDLPPPAEDLDPSPPSESES